MGELIDWTRHALDGGELHPLLVIGIFVATFLAIHPFQDGNGRLSRILTTLLLLRTGYAYVPYGSLESVIEQNKEAYYLALRKTQGTLGSDAPDWEPWLVYFLTALRRQKNRLQQRIDRERLILGDLPELSVMILDVARDRGRVSVADAARVTGASRNTIKGPHAGACGRRPSPSARSGAGNMVFACMDHARAMIDRCDGPVEEARTRSFRELTQAPRDGTSRGTTRDRYAGAGSPSTAGR